MKQETLGKMLIKILNDSLLAIFYFPLWWYSVGLLKVIKGSWNFIKDMEISLGFWIWIKNLFVPMFGQRDFAGRLISIFLRLFEIIFKGIILLIIIVIALVFVVFWLILPILVIYQIFSHF
jgi:hypothetical protein